MPGQRVKRFPSLVVSQGESARLNPEKADNCPLTCDKPVARGVGNCWWGWGEFFEFPLICDPTVGENVKSWSQMGIFKFPGAVLGNGERLSAGISLERLVIRSAQVLHCPSGAGFGFRENACRVIGVTSL
ncbi:hypothetical protein Nans01_47220 [Nocardiopsis ansamitocini]|uniref:Uncharacterized protein n=1 Tax=Nocardiopsis ansamitocini TaxID=1670832 RepID=A0A9W6UIX6_9ACTN|nr:hypothetical protein Nans01_47220 [Nocardiopsis ansamitocini]